MNGFVTFGYVGLSCVHRGQGRPRLPRAFICGKPLVSAYAAARKPQRVLTFFLCSVLFWGANLTDLPINSVRSLSWKLGFRPRQRHHVHVATVAYQRFKMDVFVVVSIVS